MGVERYKVMLVDARRNKLWREWSAAELVHSVPWLKRMNARGHDVFVAPAGQHGLFLLDGLREENVAEMTGKGFEPAATIQIAPGRYQAWVKLSDRPISGDVSQHAYNGLKHAFGRTPRYAKGSEYGRLAGFTCGSSANDQEAVRQFVLIRNAGGAVAREAAALLSVIQKATEKPQIQQREILRENNKLAPKHRGPSR